MRIYKVVLNIVIVFASIVFIGWLAFYSSFIANKSQVISVRNFYFDNLYKYGPKNILYFRARPIQVSKTDESTWYKYKMVGKFVRIDYLNKIITVKDVIGKEWNFKFDTGPTPTGNTDYELLMLSEGAVDVKVVYMVINVKNPDETVPYFKEGDILTFFWGDKNKLNYFKDLQRQNEIVALQGAGVVPIIKTKLLNVKN